MAQIQRRLWSEIKTEALRRLGGVQYTGFSSRVEYWIWEAYQKLCLTYNHYELQDEVVIGLATGESSITLPDGAYAVMGVAEVNASSQVVRVLQNRHDLIRQGLFVIFSGQPENYSRAGHRGTRLQFDRPTNEDRSYRISLYRFPEAPDFSAASGANFSLPQIPAFWEAAILDATVVRAGASVAAVEVLAAAQQALGEFLGEQIQSPLIDQPPGDLPGTSRADAPKGGLQG
jgi:hypothetical protein